ncbi:DDE-type integrase/transposase/recombinase, partial [Klebsiella pneumoniae]|uniref:DDE-type integrase/transposase/recombinase n=1 Tax=Klebsiella pneumoniae TaxID=573 RepID=UPI003EBF35E3
GQFNQPSRRFGHIHVDVVGPLPTSQGCRYIFTIIDRSTRWPEAVPMTDATTDSCASALIEAWISRFGLPDQITSDRGAVFTSSLWQQLTRRLGISTTTTSAYNPEANGMVERFHRSLKAALMSRCSSERWKPELPWVMLGLRTAPKDNDDHSPAERVYGDPLTVPADFFRPATDLPPNELHESVQRFIPCQQTYTRAKKIHLPAD